MANAFGEYTRNLRHKNSELLKNMAERLGVSPAFLSAVETGNKSVPPGWYEKLVAVYRLDPSEAGRLRAAINQSQRSVTIDLEGQSAERRGVAVELARRFHELSDEELDLIRQNMFSNFLKGER